MKEKFKVKNKQVVRIGIVVGGEEVGEHKTLSKFLQW